VKGQEETFADLSGSIVVEFDRVVASDEDTTATELGLQLKVAVAIEGLVDSRLDTT
jgi:hypothetical protein